LLVRLIAAALATMYAVACVGKARHREEFEGYLRPLMRGRARSLRLATLLAEAGLTCVLALSMFTTPIAPWVGLASALFLLIATAAHAAILAGGSSEECRCFGRVVDLNAPRQLQPALFAVRNWTLMSASLLLVPPLAVHLAFGFGAVVPTVTAVGLLWAVRRDRLDLGLAEHPLVAVYAPRARHLLAHTWWVNGHPRAF
jgi:hypothetical protein